MIKSNPIVFYCIGILVVIPCLLHVSQVMKSWLYSIWDWIRERIVFDCACIHDELINCEMIKGWCHKISSLLVWVWQIGQVDDIVWIIPNN